MSDKKDYYYIRIKENFYESDKMAYLQSLPQGYEFSDILMKMYLKSLSHNGQMKISNRIPYSPETIAKITGHDLATTQKALMLFKELELIEILSNGFIFMLDIQELIGKSSTEADRKRRWRLQVEEEKKKLLEEKEEVKTIDTTQVESEWDICPTEMGHLSGHFSTKDRDRDRDRDIVRDRIIVKENETKVSDDDLQKYLLDDLRLETSSSKNVVKALKEVGKDINYLKEKVELTEAKTIGGAFKNVGFLVKAIKGDWKNDYKPKADKPKAKKTAFHNFEHSSERDYTDNELNSYISNVKIKKKA